MINLNNVSFSYGDKKILENFNLKVEAGERICLFGESGKGKTTVLRLILGLEIPNSGNAVIEGKASVVFQENRLLPFETVLDNIRTVKGDEEKARKLLEKFGLADYAEKYPRSLSGGMKRRVAIIRALCSEFDFLVLDEPFAGLDKENIELAAQIINEYSKDKAIILVTHSEWEASLLGAKIVNI